MMRWRLRTRLKRVTTRMMKSKPKMLVFVWDCYVMLDMDMGFCPIDLNQGYLSLSVCTLTLILHHVRHRR